MSVRSRLGWIVAVGVFFGGSAFAGLLDSQPPVLAGGKPATVVYRMGAVHFEPGGWVDTTVTCTNLSAEPAQLALEIFDENDRLAGQAAQATAAPGARVTFENSLGGTPVHQQIWMLTGLMDLRLGKEISHLGAGDCMAMTLDQPISFHNPGKKEARYLVAVSRLAK